MTDRVKYTNSRRVREITATVTHADTSPTDVFTLPKGARVLDWIANVKTAFSGGDTRLGIGTSLTGYLFATGVDISSAGKASITVANPGAELDYATGCPTTISVIVGGSNSAGSLDLTCLYSLNKDTRQ